MLKQWRFTENQFLAMIIGTFLMAMFSVFGFHSSHPDMVAEAEYQCDLDASSIQKHTKGACKVGVSIAVDILAGYKKENGLESPKAAPLALEMRESLTENAFKLLQDSCNAEYGNQRLADGISQRSAAMHCLKSSPVNVEVEGVLKLDPHSSLGMELTHPLQDCNNTCEMAVCKYLTADQFRDDVGRFLDVDLLAARCDVHKDISNTASLYQLNTIE